MQFPSTVKDKIKTNRLQKHIGAKNVSANFIKQRERETTLRVQLKVSDEFLGEQSTRQI